MIKFDQSKDMLVIHSTTVLVIKTPRYTLPDSTIGRRTDNFFSINSCPLDGRFYPIDVRLYPFHIRTASVLSFDVHSVRWRV